MTTPSTPVALRVLATPYVSVAEFRSSPTWLDTDDLVQNATAAQQDTELYNKLLVASEWADSKVNPDYGIGARTVVQQVRTRPDRRGRLSIHADMAPVRQVTGLAYGCDPNNLTVQTDLSGIWLEGRRQQQILVPYWAPELWGPNVQFGGRHLGGEIYARVTFTAGYSSTTLTGPVAAGGVSLPVADATGVMPGDILRLWDPGAEEAVTVSPAWTPAAGAASIPITGGLTGLHLAGTLVSGVPSRIHQAVICYAVSLLLRQDVTDDAPFAGAPYGPAARKSKSGGQSGGLVNEARELLRSYATVR